jgi:phosphoribosylanthranilate isomerase
MSAAKVKICGLTTVSDAALAASLGADYLGVIFADSLRRVDIARAQEIRALLPSAALVGVFKDQSLDDVVRASLACDLDLIQLHGGETPAYCDDVLQRAGKPVVKAFRAAHVPGAAELASFRTTQYFLFDYDRDDDDERAWDDVATTRALGFRLFVAGGLDATNVRAIVARTRAFAVDVCRGVEREPGIKDPRALERFMTEARA